MPATAQQPGPHEAYRFAGLVLDVGQRRLLAADDTEVTLTSGEFDLLRVFAEHPQRVLSRDQLLDFARGIDTSPFDRSIDVHVSRLRRKIETDSDKPVLIKTVRNAGYIFTPAVEYG